MLNKDEAQRTNNELHKDAMRQQIRDVLVKARLPVTVATIVKHTGLQAKDIRDVLLDMVVDEEVKEVAWRYTL